MAWQGKTQTVAAARIIGNARRRTGTYTGT
jgi:hypothetical protein